MKNVTLLNRVTSRHHRRVTAEIQMYLGKERNFFLRKPPSNSITLHNRQLEFAVNIQSRYAALNSEGNLSVEEINKKVIKIIKEATHQ